MGLLVLLLFFDVDDDGMLGDLCNMVWKGYYLGYGLVDVMLYVLVDLNFICQNGQVLIFVLYFCEGYVLVYDSECVCKVSSFEDFVGQVIGVEQGLGGVSVLFFSVNGVLCDKVKIYLEVNEVLCVLFFGQIVVVMVMWV